MEEVLAKQQKNLQFGREREREEIEETVDVETIKVLVH
jgi:hypothetical protein